jgi:hypothetical protein
MMVQEIMDGMMVRRESVFAWIEVAHRKVSIEPSRRARHQLHGKSFLRFHASNTFSKYIMPMQPIFTESKN